MPLVDALAAWLAAVSGALAAALAARALVALVAALPRGPAPGRERPPLALRPLWPLVRALAPTAATWHGPQAQEHARRLLRRAGLDYAIAPAEWLALRWLGAAGGLLLGVLAAPGGAAGAAGAAPWAALGAGLGGALPGAWRARAIRARNARLLRAMPFFLDAVTLAVEAGLTPTGALQQAAARLPPGPLVDEIERLLRDVRAGKPRADALRDRAAELAFAPFSGLASALVQGELTGTGLAPVLRAQSEQRRTERFLRAEKQALEAPVRMLAPLILCIFPCTFIVLGFPIAARLLGALS